MSIMSIYGIQFQSDEEVAVIYNRELKPTTVMGIEVVKEDFWRRLYGVNPNADYIWRHHPDRPWAERPEEQARDTIEHVRAKVGRLISAGIISHMTCNNEYIFPSDPSERIEAADRYIAQVIYLARSELGIGVCWGNFNTGWWGGGEERGMEIVNALPRSLQAAEEDGDCPISFHEYDWPVMSREWEESGGFYCCGKILWAMPAIRERFPNVPCMITELGVDSLARIEGDHRGWQDAHPDFNTAIEMFLGDQGLTWYYETVAKPAMVELGLKGIIIFGCGMPWWRSFDIKPIIESPHIERFRIFPVVKPPSPPPEPEPEPPPGPQPPEPPNGGNEMDIRVVDFEYKDRDFEYVKQKYGVAYRRAKVQPGQKVYRLVELWEKTGTSSLVSQVLNEDGSPMANVDVAFNWPDAPDPPDPPTVVYDHDWYKRFKHGSTNLNGDVGPGMGPGAYHGEGEGGPHAVWVRDPNIPSDICEKLGMLAGTNHDHLDQKFQLMVEPGDDPDPPPPEPDPGKMVLEFVERIEVDHPTYMLGVGIPAESQVEKDFVMDTRGVGVGPGTEEEVEPVEWNHPTSGKAMSLAEKCCDFEGDEPRGYSISLIRLPGREQLAAPEPELVPPLGTPRKRVVFVYKLVEKPGPVPPPPPPGPGEPGAAIALIEEIEQDLAELKQIFRTLDAQVEQLAVDAREAADQI